MSVAVNQSWSADQKKNLQKMLNQYGFTDDSGNPLAVDGMIGPKTQQALAKMNTYQQHLTKPDASTAAWQEQLNDWGYTDANGMPLKADGVYGPKTDAATNNFENNFFGGFTGDTNQKKTVPQQTYPTMPKASDSQIQAAVATQSGTPYSPPENSSAKVSAQAGGQSGTPYSPPENSGTKASAQVSGQSGTPYSPPENSSAKVLAHTGGQSGTPYSPPGNSSSKASVQNGNQAATGSPLTGLTASTGGAIPPLKNAGSAVDWTKIILGGIPGNNAQANNAKTFIDPAQLARQASKLQQQPQPQTQTGGQSGTPYSPPGNSGSRSSVQAGGQSGTPYSPPGNNSKPQVIKLSSDGAQIGANTNGTNYEPLYGSPKDIDPGNVVNYSSNYLNLDYMKEKDRGEALVQISALNALTGNKLDPLLKALQNAKTVNYKNESENWTIEKKKSDAIEEKSNELGAERFLTDALWMVENLGESVSFLEIPGALAGIAATGLESNTNSQIGTLGGYGDQRYSGKDKQGTPIKAIKHEIITVNYTNDGVFGEKNTGGSIIDLEYHMVDGHKRILSIKLNGHEIYNDYQSQE